MINDIKCLTCINCNEGQRIDNYIDMFKCKVYDLWVPATTECKDFEKETRDKISQSQEVIKNG